MDGMKAMVEKAFKLTGMRVTIVAHSMGNLYTAYWLNSIEPEWKDQYLENYVAVSAPFLGATKATAALIDVDNLAGWLAPFVKTPAFKIMKTIENMSGVVGLQPYGWGDRPIVTDKKNGRVYKSADIAQMFVDLGLPTTAQVYSWIATAQPSVYAPEIPKNVRVYAVTSDAGAQSTITSLEYNELKWNTAPTKTVMGPGDGTVPQYSLDHVVTWYNAPNFHKHSVCPGVDHQSAVSDPKCFGPIIDFILDQQ
jgi:hypothetical protein